MSADPVASLLAFIPTVDTMDAAAKATLDGYLSDEVRCGAVAGWSTGETGRHVISVWSPVRCREFRRP